uniref:Protein KTI12 homolog n=1 Tax=Oryza nivara TaxID=4536 RepID=A0A0E0HC09_ORYNI
MKPYLQNSPIPNPQFNPGIRLRRQAAAARRYGPTADGDTATGSCGGRWGLCSRRGRRARGLSGRQAAWARCGAAALGIGAAAAGGRQPAQQGSRQQAVRQAGQQQVYTFSMALVVICGQPCSGKSAAAACLTAALCSSTSDLTVRIIDESSLHLGRNDSYKDMVVEKNLRGVLRSEVDRSVSRDSIIVVDSLNNIKGYRYELWCLARASGIRYCVLFCDTEVDHCREWNTKRQEKGEPTYDNNMYRSYWVIMEGGRLWQVRAEEEYCGGRVAGDRRERFDDLVSRFEKPDRRNRWDSPLFELFPSRDGVMESSPVIAEAVSYLTKKVDSKTRDVKVLQPTIATQTARTTEANSLYEMDKATQEVINAIVEAQSCGLGLPVNKISLGPDLPTISFTV